MRSPGTVRRISGLSWDVLGRRRNLLRLNSRHMQVEASNMNESSPTTYPSVGHGRVYEGHPHLLAEMYAYSVASAHLELPHLRLDNYMTSETEAYGEGWPFVDELPIRGLCTQDLSEHTHRLPVG